MVHHIQYHCFYELDPLFNIWELAMLLSGAILNKSCSLNTHYCGEKEDVTSPLNKELKIRTREESDRISKICYLCDLYGK
jgi:hypothetical protein